MAVTGIGGVFFKAKDPQALQLWYKKYLGIDFESWGAVFHWKNFPEGSTAFSIASQKSTHFEGQFMLNFRVDNLDEILQLIRTDGQKNEEQEMDESYGRFAWVYDPEGNKIELWQPNDGIL